MLAQSSVPAVGQVAIPATDAASEWEGPTILSMDGSGPQASNEGPGDEAADEQPPGDGESIEDPPAEAAEEPDAITTREPETVEGEDITAEVERLMTEAGIPTEGAAVVQSRPLTATEEELVREAAAPQEATPETTPAASDTLILHSHAPPRSVTLARIEREEMIRDSQQSIGELAREIANAKAHLKDVTKAFNKEVEHLDKLISKPVEALPIIDRIEARESEAESPRATVAEQASPAAEVPTTPPVDVNAWRKRPISELGLRSSVEEKLLGAGLDTMGVLEDRRAEVYSGREKWPKGIGKQKVTMIEDAIMEWLSANRDGGVLASAMTPQPRADVPTTEGRLTTVGGLVEEAMFKAEAEKSAEDPADAADSNPADSAAEAAGSTGKGEEPKQGDPNEVVDWIEIPLSFGSAKIAAEEFDDNKWRISWEVDFPGFGGSSWTAHPDHVPINTRANALVGAASKVWNEVSKALNAAIKAGSPQQLLTGLQAMHAEAFEFLSKAGSL